MIYSRDELALLGDGDVEGWTSRESRTSLPPQSTGHSDSVACCCCCCYYLARAAVCDASASSCALAAARSERWCARASASTAAPECRGRSSPSIVAASVVPASSDLRRYSAVIRSHSRGPRRAHGYSLGLAVASDACDGILKSSSRAASLSNRATISHAVLARDDHISKCLPNDG